MHFFSSAYTASFVMSFMNCLVSVALSMFLAQVKGSSPFVIGLAGFSGNFIYTITAVLQSRMTKRKRIILFISAPLAACACYVGLAFVLLPALFALLLAAGFFYAIFWPSMQYFFTGTEGEKRTGFFNLSWSSGLIFGAFFAGSIYSLDYRAPFLLSVPLGIFAFIILFSRKEKICSIDMPSKSGSIMGKTPAALHPLVQRVRLLNFIHFMTAGSVMFLFPKLGLSRGFSPLLVGNILAILLFFRLAVFYMLRNKPVIVNRWGFLASCALFCASCFMIGLGKGPLQVVGGTAILGITGALAYHNSMLLHSKYRLPMEIHESLVGGGNFTGPLIVGLLGQAFSLPASFVTVGIGILATGILFSLRKRES